MQFILYSDSDKIGKRCRISLLKVSIRQRFLNLSVKLLAETKQMLIFTYLKN